MKGLHYLSAIFLLAVSSCQWDDTATAHPQEGKGKEVRFSLSQTRASQTGSFDKGDEIGVFATLHGDFTCLTAANVKYAWNGSHFESEHPILYKGKPLDFYVYYPYEAANTGIRAIRHSVTSQATAAGWQASDFLTATNLSGIAEGDIPLSFQHKYATVRFGAEEIPGMAGCRLDGLKIHASLDFWQNTALAEGGRSDIEMLDRGLQEGVRMYEATVPVQDMQGTVFTIRKTGGGEIKCPVAVPAMLEEGKLRYFGVALMRTIAFGSYPLHMGSPTGDGKYAFGESCTLKALPSTGYHFTGWYEHSAKVSDEATYTFQVINNRLLTPTYVTETVVTDYEITVSPGSHTFSRDGGSYTFQVTCYRVTYVYHDGALYSTDRSAYTGYSTSVTGSGFSLSGNTVTASKNKDSARQGAFEASVGNVSATASLSQEEGQKFHIETEIQ